MTTEMIGIAFGLAWFCFAVPVAVFLLRAYGRSKMSGFLWLLGAVVIWPLCARVLTAVMGMAAAMSHAGVNSMLTVSLGETVIGGGLLLVAAILLDRELKQRIVGPVPVSAVSPSAVPPPPTDLR